MSNPVGTGVGGAGTPRLGLRSLRQGSPGHCWGGAWGLSEGPGWPIISFSLLAVPESGPSPTTGPVPHPPPAASAATTQAGAPAAAPALATAMEATAAAAVGPAAARAAPPGPPVPATTAGAVQKVGASEPRQTQLSAPWHRERRGVRPQDSWGALHPTATKRSQGQGRPWGWASCRQGQAGFCCF